MLSGGPQSLQKTMHGGSSWGGPPSCLVPDSRLALSAPALLCASLGGPRPGPRQVRSERHVCQALGAALGTGLMNV